MSEIQDNEILADCAWFADKHRGKNRLSGPHWSTIMRLTPLFDEAVRLQALEGAYENDLVLFYVTEKLKKAEARVNELEDKKQTVFELLTNTIARRDERIAELENERRWIPVSEFIAKKGGVYYFEDLRGKLLLGYFQPKDKAHFQLEHYAKRIFAMPLPQPPESEGE